MCRHDSRRSLQRRRNHMQAFAFHCGLLAKGCRLRTLPAPQSNLTQVADRELIMSTYLATFTLERTRRCCASNVGMRT
jgi:hypothetical protein